MDVFISKEFSGYYKKAPLTLVDIGARGGLQKNWDRAKRHIKIIGFEPDKQEFEKLEKSSDNATIKYINAALYKDKRLVEFYLTKNRGVSSMFKPNMELLSGFPEAERFEIEETMKLGTDSLDDQLKENNIEDIDFIKIDTQGSELGILEGADKNIRNNVFGLEIEVEFVPIYKDQPLFSDIDTFLRRFGFHLFDLRPFYWKRLDGTAFGRPKGQIIFADVLYLKDTQGLQYILSKISDNTLKKSKVLRAVSICIVYGYLDYALEIFKANGALFTKSESEDFTGRLNSEVMLAHKFPNFRGRSRIADILYSIYKVVHPSGRGWVFRDRTLGNIE